MNSLFRRWGARSLPLLLVVAVACSGDEEAALPVLEEGSSERELRRAAFEESLRDHLRDSLHRAVESWLDESLRGSPVRDVLQADEELVPLRRRLFLEYVYRHRDHAPLFFESGNATHRAEAALRIIEEAPTHALDPSHYLIAPLEEALSLQERWGIVRSMLEVPQLTVEEKEAILALASRVDVDDIQGKVGGLFDTLLAAPSPPETLVPLRTWLTELRDAERASRGADTMAEVLLADAMLHYAFDMRHGNVRMFGERVSENERLEIIAERMRSTFDAIAETTTVDDAWGVLHDLRPHQPQYDPLLRERERYEAIVAAGGWPEVRPFRASRGQRHRSIPQLRERLAIEGYYEGELDNDRFDEALAEAIRFYQRTHQMDVTGEFHGMFWTSLNIPAERRFAQIELTLQRWRESRISDEDYYILVNIPDFHAEVWRNGVLDKRFAVVVGNNERRCNPRTRQLELINATPIESFRMTYMVLNPYWYVPRRLVNDDLLPRLLDDPTFFERMGYEPYTTSDGFEVIRQRPGPNNALGRVKFMFPNTHNVYMHDTPAQNYFRLGIRSMSSGCVRVSRPMELMEYLLENDGQWDPARIERIFDSEQETSIVLRQGVPVFFEYYVVRVDDDGYANFLADIYRYDRQRLDPSENETDLSCEPPPRETPPLVLGEDGRVMFRGEDGELIDPDTLGEEEEGAEDGADEVFDPSGLDVPGAVPGVVPGAPPEENPGAPDGPVVPATERPAPAPADAGSPAERDDVERLPPALPGDGAP